MEYLYIGGLLLSYNKLYGSKKMNTEEKYECQIDLDKNQHGKIIVYQEGNQVNLAGNMIPISELFETMDREKLSFRGIEYYLEDNVEARSRNNEDFGYHRKIKRPSDSKVFGGAFVVILDGNAYVNGKSNDYGPLKRETLEKFIDSKHLFTGEFIK